MSYNIELNCPHCYGSNIVRNGLKYNGLQNYLCKTCKKQFIGDRERTCRGTIFWISAMVKIMLVRGNGMRGINAVLGISVKKLLKIPGSARYEIKPKQNRYDCLEIDVFWTYVQEKNRKHGLYTHITGKAGE